MNNCVFCDIIAGFQPASVVHRDKLCIAFMDIQPINPGHLLIVPLDHAANLADLDPQTGGHLFSTAQHIAAAIRRSGLPCQGINLFLADGEAAGQDVFHIHLHVVPRNAGDGFGLTFDPSYNRLPGRDELDRNAWMIGREIGLDK